MKKLFDLDPAEVSLVAKGANKRKFLIWKSDEGEEVEMPNKIPDHANPEMPVKSPQDIAEDHGVPPQPLSARAKAAVLAVVRILKPFKGEIKDADLDQALADSGIIPMEDNKMPAAIEADPEKMPMNDVKKLGENKDLSAPLGKVETNTEKDSEDDTDEDEQDEDEQDEDEDDDQDAEDMVGKMADCKDKDEMIKVAKMFLNKSQGGQSVGKKSVMKSDGSIDMTAVPADVRPAVEAIYKSQRELVKKNEELSTQLSTERKERRTKEFVAKAESFKHFTGDKTALAEQLMSLEETNKPLYETVLKQFEGVDAEKEAVHKSLTAELGSGLSAGAMNAEAKIDAAVAQMVQKSDGGISSAKAYEKFIASPEGQKLYAEYKSNRKGGV